MNTVNLIDEDNNKPTIHNASNLSAENDLSDILQGLKEKFRSLPPNDPDGIAFLTILPLNWTIEKISLEFNTSTKSVRKAKDLKKLYDSLSRPKLKLGNAVSEADVNKVINFYEDDDNSRLLPGIKNQS